MNLQIQLPIKDIENKVNSALKEVLFEGEIGEEEDIRITVMKRAPLRLRAELDTIFVEAAIKAQVDIGESTLLSWFKGLVRKIEAVEVSITAFFEIKPDVSPQWQLIPKVKGRFVWDKEPNLTLAGIKLPLTSPLQWVIESQIRNVCKIIEKYLKEDLDIAQYVKIGWDIMQKPLEISKENQLWIHFNPSASPIYATPIYSNGGYLTATVSVSLFPIAYVGSMPASEPLMPLPDFEPATKLPTNSDIALSGEVSYAFIKQFLEGKTFTLSGIVHALTIKRLQLKEKNDQIAAEIDTLITLKWAGIVWDLSAHLTAEGNLSASEDGTLKVAPLLLTFNGGNVILGLLFPLFKTQIQNVLTRTLSSLANTYMLEITRQVDKALDNNQLHTYVGLDGELQKFTFVSAEILPDTARVWVDGHVSVRLEIGNF